MLEDKKKVLFLRFSSLGDIVIANYSAMMIKKKHPAFHLTWMTDALYAGIVRAQPWVDDVIEWDRKRTGNRGYCEILRKVRHMGFDILVDMHATDRSSLFSLLSGIPKRYAEHGYNWPLAHTNIGLGGLLGDCPNIGTCRKYLYTPTLNNDIAGLCRKGYKKLGLAIGASSVVKRWPVRRWIEFCSIASDAGYDMFLIGNGQDELEAAETIISEVGSRHVINVVGRTSITDTVALTAQMNVVVAGDTGIMHIARALGIPVVGLFGPNQPMVGEEYMKSIGLLYFCECPDRGCQKKECSRQCLEDIPASVVWDGIRKIIGGID